MRPVPPSLNTRHRLSIFRGLPAAARDRGCGRPGQCGTCMTQNGLDTERHDRRLSAILAADVVGYSRLMGVDEDATLHALTAHRKAVIDPAIASHRGRVVKTTGDGMLVEFGSAVDAVRCAVD